MDQKQFEALLSDAEIRLRRLKTLYDQWLAGIERLEPNIPRKELEELLARLKREHIRNTALRFRLQQISQRHMTFTTYWKRLARQIEEGTYQRDVLKARKLREEREQGDRNASGDGGYEVDVDVDLDGALAAAAEHAAAERAASVAPEPAAAISVPAAAAPPAAADRLDIAASALQPPSLIPKPSANRPPPPPIPPRASAGPRAISPFALPLPAGATASKAPPIPPGAAAGVAAPPPPTAAGLRPSAPLPPARPPAKPALPSAPASAANGGGSAAGSLSSDDVQRIYARYLAARKDNSERVDNVRIENIEKSLRGMLPQLEKKHAGKKIDFEVVVKDGKVALKPVPK